MNPANGNNNSSRDERWDGWGAWLVIVGLIAEVILAIAFKKANEPWYEVGSLVFANGLIVVGLLLEWHFGGNIKAKAKAREAEAHARARQYELELEKIKLPRKLDAKQTRSLSEAMSPFRGHRVSVGATPLTVEAESLALQIVAALTGAGVEARLNQGAAEAHIGAAQGVVARCTTGNPAGEKFVVTFAQTLISIGIVDVLATGGLLEDIVPKLAEQGRPREHSDNSWVVISVGAKF